ncbi:MAG: HAD family hydrolase [Propioniciclava sp.]
MHADSCSPPAALLWDFDGTLGETEQLWWQAEARFMADLGVVETDEEARGRVGLSMADSLTVMLERAGRPDLDRVAAGDRLNRDVLEAVTAAPITFRPGARELLSQARAAGIRCALVSQSAAVILAAATAQLPAESFAVVLGGDQVGHPKPHPEPYLRAAAMLDVAPEHCLVIEDSPSGLAAAVSAGIPALGVPFHGVLQAGPHQRIVPTLAGLTLDDVATLFQEVSGA